MIVQNILHEGPGLLQKLLAEKAIAYEVIEMQETKSFPLLQDYGAVVVCGGPDSANDSTAKMQAELAGIRQALALGIPYLGICLGMQALVKAAGGHVLKHTAKEVGFRDPENHFFEVKLTALGRKDELFVGLADKLRVFHLHGETVTLSPGINLLGVGKFCHNQIVKVGKKAYGLQCHFELTDEMFTDWMKEDPDLREIPEDQLRQDYQLLRTDYQQTGIKLFQNFLTLAGY